jgi:PAS domain S-box-containing protein
MESEFPSEILSVIEDGSLVVNSSGCVEFISEPLAHLIGFHPDELLKRNVLEFVEPADHKTVQHLAADVKAGWRSKVKLSIKHKDGDMVSLEAHTYPRPNGDGFIAMLKNCNLESILAEEVQQMRQQFEQELEFISQITTSINQGLVRLDKRRAVVYCNQTTMRVLGLERPALLLGRNLLEFVPPKEHAKIIAEWELIGRGEARTYQHEIQAYDQVRQVEVSAYPTVNKNNRFLGAMLIITDLTAQLMQQNQLQDAASIAQHVNQGLAVLSQAGRFEFVNNALALMLQSTPDKLIACDAADFVAYDPDSQTSLYTRIALPDGNHLPVEVTLIPRREPQRGSILIVTNLKDQIARELEVMRASNAAFQAERELEIQDQKTRMIAEFLDKGVGVFDQNGRIEFVNQSYVKILGYSSPNELLYLHESDIIYPDDLGIYAKALTQRQNNQASRYRLRMQNHKGEPLEVEVVGYPRVVDKEFYGSVSVVTSLAAQSQRERELLESNSEYLALLEQSRQNTESLLLYKNVLQSIHDFVLITDANLEFPGPTIRYVNQAFVEHTGFRADEMIGNSPRMLQGAKTDRQMLARLKGAALRGERFYARTFNYKKDGSEYLVEWNISPVRDQNGTVTHFVSIQRDLTERQVFEVLLDYLSHEMQIPNQGNPLHVVQQFLNLKASQVQDRQSIKGKLETIGGVAVLLQMLCVSQASGMLEVKNSAQSGKIFLEHGKIVAVEHQHLSQKYAVLDLMQLEQGEFEFDLHSSDFEKTMSYDPTHLALELAKNQDEAKHPEIHLVLPNRQAADGFVLGVGGQQHFSQRDILWNGSKRLMLSGRGINILVLES